MILLTLAVAVLAVVAVACSGGHDSSNAPMTVGGMTNTVDIKSMDYKPGNLQVPVGASITFVNHDSVPHSATAKDGSWDTGLLSKNESKKLTFDKPGEYSYYCTVHPGMKARVDVSAAPGS